MSGFVNYLKNSWVAVFGRRPKFKSSKEFFAAVEALIAALKASGCEASAASLDEGYGCLTGLTDGWALFLNYAEKAERELPPRASPDDREKLREIAYAARYAVYHPRG